MGKNANQIATHRDLYYRGHTYLHTDSWYVSTSQTTYARQGVTYNDLFYKSSYYLGTGQGFWSGATILNNLGVLGTYSDGSYYLKNEYQYKCVKFQDFATANVQQPFYIRLIETLWLVDSRAHTVELRYYYKTSSTSTLTYKVVGTWDNLGNNVDGEASILFHFNANPYAVYNGDVYTGYMSIWCGTTRSKETWSYRVRTKGSSGGNTGTWGEWRSLGDGTSALIDFNVVEGENTYVESMRMYNGIEFKVD